MNADTTKSSFSGKLYRLLLYSINSKCTALIQILLTAYFTLKISKKTNFINSVFAYSTISDKDKLEKKQKTKKKTHYCYYVGLKNDCYEIAGAKPQYRQGWSDQ